MYKVEITNQVKKYVKKLKDEKLKSKFANAILQIQNSPCIGEAKKGDLAGLRCYDVFYNKTNYEIAYKDVEENFLIIILQIGTRENFYQELKNYIK